MHAYTHLCASICFLTSVNSKPMNSRNLSVNNSISMKTCLTILKFRLQDSKYHSISSNSVQFFPSYHTRSICIAVLTRCIYFHSYYQRLYAISAYITIIPVLAPALEAPVVGASQSEDSDFDVHPVGRVRAGTMLDRKRRGWFPVD